MNLFSAVQWTDVLFLQFGFKKNDSTLSVKINALLMQHHRYLGSFIGYEMNNNRAVIIH